MAFDPSVPNAAQNPRMFPQQGSIDFVRLKNIINADHVFNDAVTANDGIHKQVTLVNKDKDNIPTYVSENTSLLYSRLEGENKPTQLFYFNGTTEQQVTPDIVTFPKLLAYVNFNGYPGVSNSDRIRSSSNISSVVRDGTGEYTITFTVQPPNNNYVVQITASDPQITGSLNGSLVYGFVQSSKSYGPTVSKKKFVIQLRDNLKSKRDVNMVNIAVIRIS
jgi:hypothetical protein